MKERYVKKFMRVAKEFGTYLNPCYSRQIGAVIVKDNRVLGLGYNGPPPGTPHADSAEYLRDYFWPQLTEGERDSFRAELGGIKESQVNCEHDFDASEAGLRMFCRKCKLEVKDTKSIPKQTTLELFVKKYTNCGTCPRRLIKAGSGQRSELCSCGHAERHAITNAEQSCVGAEMLCWCGVPCLQCTDAIIQAGIVTVHCLKESVDYHPKSRWLFDKANVQVIEYERSYFDA